MSFAERVMRYLNEALGEHNEAFVRTAGRAMAPSQMVADAIRGPITPEGATKVRGYMTNQVEFASGLFFLPYVGAAAGVRESEVRRTGEVQCSAVYQDIQAMDRIISSYGDAVKDLFRPDLLAPFDPRPYYGFLGHVLTDPEAEEWLPFKAAVTSAFTALVLPEPAGHLLENAIKRRGRKRFVDLATDVYRKAKQPEGGAVPDE